MKLRALFSAVLLGGTGILAGQEAQLLEKQNVVDVAKPGGDWTPAREGQPLNVNDRVRTGPLSRALVRLTNLAVLRMNELTSVTILPPEKAVSAPGLNLLKGGIYFLSRERPEEIRIRSPSANGIMRGTEFLFTVEGAKTSLMMLEGEVEIGNERGRVTAHHGERVEITAGEAPRKTSMIEARNIIQWCLYYPAVLPPEELALSRGERETLAGSLAAYGAGDLPGALRAFPRAGLPGSPAGRVYTAVIFLSAGQVEKAERLLSHDGLETPGVAALRTLIAAVKFEELHSWPAAKTAGDALALSYYEQSRSHLELARAAARRATELAPRSGFAWTRLAELEFSFGRVPEARRALEQGRLLAPRDAHAAVLGGFIQSAENRIAPARASFEAAIALDPSLGTAWLGRGLTRIRRGDAAGGREDLQAAAALEPNRSLFRSYLGKAWGHVGDAPRADRELTRAIDLDANDPTPWLYRALQDREENKLNAAVRDLEESQRLNDNRSLFRSRFLLDQDKAVRGANLAGIYQRNGMSEVAIREAAQAVNLDYASAGAHLFLANSYDALRDPERIVLRFETPAQSEQLLANLLAPVGAGPLSQFVSEQEYSKLLESDGLGFAAAGEYRSDGQYHETSSLFGTYGNMSFALDSEYFRNNDPRPARGNSWRADLGVKLKLQVTPADVVYLEVGGENLRGGDTRQLYSERAVLPSVKLREDQEPGAVLLGLRHQWAPGVQTLVLAGRLASEQTIQLDTSVPVFTLRQVAVPAGGQVIPPSGQQVFMMPSNFPSVGIPKVVKTNSSMESRASAPAPRPRAALLNFLTIGGAPFREYYDLDLAVNSGEVQQIVTAGPHTFVGGVRYQQGDLNLRTSLVDRGETPDPRFANPAAFSDFETDIERLNLYVYDTFRLTRALTLIGGTTFDRVTYPKHFRNPPLRDESERLEHWSPKAGLIYEPWSWLRLRGAYTEAMSGVSLDESLRLEPVQIAGFNQGFRTLLNESTAGSVSAARYKIAGAALDARLPTGTYLGLEWSIAKQEADSVIGDFGVLTSADKNSVHVGRGLLEQLDYEERAFSATLNQLVAGRWSFRAAYRVTWSEFQGVFPALRSRPGRGVQHQDSDLQQLDLGVLWNHESGLFAQAGALWTRQENDGFPLTTHHATGEPGDDFWQLNAFVGYRFRRNRGEVSVGVLNALNTDYQLEPLSPYLELPHERALVVRCRVNF